MSAKGQIDKLAAFILENAPAEVETATGDMAIMLLDRFAKAMIAALNELGVPGPDYPAPVANAVELLTVGLGQWEQK